MVRDKGSWEIASTGNYTNSPGDKLGLLYPGGSVYNGKVILELGYSVKNPPSDGKLEFRQG